jgi:hypothetical protein|tara:strand:- start:341 stop:556 length:216 start_codon:yes stop_codon:yes gene_type:complete
MDSFKSTMQGLVANQTVFPNHTQCPGCGYFNIRDMEVQTLMAEAGKALVLASRPRGTACKEGETCVATWPE